jgi:hypothetical protein
MVLKISQSNTLSNNFFRFFVLCLSYCFALAFFSRVSFAMEVAIDAHLLNKISPYNTYDGRESVNIIMHNEQDVNDRRGLNYNGELIINADECDFDLSVRFLGASPNLDSLRLIKPGELGLFCEGEKLYYKIYDKEIVQIMRADEAHPQGLSPEFFDRLTKTIKYSIKPEICRVTAEQEGDSQRDLTYFNYDRALENITKSDLEALVQCILLDSSAINDVGSKDINLETWLRDHIFSDELHKCTTKNYFLFSIAALSSIGRGGVYFKLGYDFGQRIFSAIQIDLAKEILSSFYGIGVFIPTAILGAKITFEKFKEISANILTMKSECEKAIEGKQTCINSSCFKERALNVLKKTPAFAAGIISAAPMTYLAYQKFHETLGWWWLVSGIPTFYMRTLIDYYSITTLAGKAYEVYGEVKTLINHCDQATSHPSSIDGVISQLGKARSFITSLNRSQAEKLVHSLNEQSVLSEKTARLFHPESFFINEPQEDSFCKKIGKKISGGIGALIGGYGASIYYPVAKEAFIPVLSLLNIDKNEALLTGLAVTSTIAASSLAALATWDSTHKFYDAICSIASWCCPRPEVSSRVCGGESIINCKRMTAVTIATILAAFTLGMQVEVGLEFPQHIGSDFNLVAAAISAFSVSFWPVDHFLLTYWLKDNINQSLLVEKIDEIIAKVPSMSSDSLKSLESLLLKKYRGNSE